MSLRILAGPLAFLLLLVPAAAKSQEAKRLVLIAGRPSHGPGDHEFRAGCLLLKKGLEGFPGLEVTVVANGWPEDPSVLERATAIVCYADGGGGHPFIQGDHLKLIGQLAHRGVGIGFLHFGVEVPKDRGGPEFLEWVGGYYENLYSCNPMWSPDYRTFPDHPIARGVGPFSTEDEWYMNIRFRADSSGITPLLVAKPSDRVRKGPYVYPKGPYDHVVAASGREEVMMWCVERPDGGRGFGFTGGHRHRNWGNPEQRKIVLNALVWISKLEVPRSGVSGTVTAADLEENLDPKKK